MTKIPPADEIKAARGRILLERLGRGKSLYRDVTWPGGNLTIRIRALTASDRQLATAHAVQRLNDIGLPMQPLFAEEYAEEVVVQRLWRALEDPANPVPGSTWGECYRLFEEAGQLRDTSTPNERAALFDTLVDLENEIDPTVEEMDPDDVQAIIEAIKKKDPNLLRGFGSRTLRAFLLSGVLQPVASPTGN